MAGDMSASATENAPRKIKAATGRGAAAFVRFSLCLGCLLPLACGAENLQDPTRPPAGLFQPQENAAVAVARRPQLQSVQISGGRRSAIISGQRVVVGDRFGNARVVGMNENQVVLKSGSGLQTLRLFPGVDKRILIRTQRDTHGSSQ